jgi:hypothetical protein
MKQTIESLEKELKDTQIKLEELISYKPVNNMGSWAKSVRIDSLKSTISKLEKKIKKLNKSE